MTGLVLGKNKRRLQILCISGNRSMISLAEVLNPVLKRLFVALQDDTPTQIKSTISRVTRLSLLPVSQIKQIIFIWFLSHIRDYIGKKLMTWKNQVQFTVMKRFQMVGATPLA